MPCESLEGGIAICRPNRFEEIHREELDVRWCFICRKRRMFVYVVEREVEPSYYDPHPTIKCVDKGHADGDCFPGQSREWEG